MGNPKGYSANLRPPWQKGQSGNPGGRPKDVLTQALRKKLSDDEADGILAIVIRLAKQGDMRAVQLLWDRMEGRALDRKEVGQPGAFDAQQIPDDKLRNLLDLAEKRASKSVKAVKADDGDAAKGVA